MSFVERVIEVSVQLVEGTFNGISDKVTLSGLRVKADLTSAGYLNSAQLFCRIYGLPLEMMSRLTRIGLINTINSDNVIQIAAGNKGSALTTAFTGEIIQAYADFNGMPEVSLDIIARPLAGYGLKPVEAISYIGPTNVSDIMKTLASNMKLAFVNYGVSVFLISPYLDGTTLTQLRKAANAANINYSIDNNTLSIWPKEAARNMSIIDISPELGMVGYPIYSSMGILVKTIYNPNVFYGGTINLSTSLGKAAQGTWIIHNVDHELESQTPNGAWFTYISAHRIDE